MDPVRLQFSRSRKSIGSVGLAEGRDPVRVLLLRSSLGLGQLEQLKENGSIEVVII